MDNGHGLMFYKPAAGPDRAGHIMGIAIVKKLGNELRARVLAVHTAGMEVASERWIHGTGYIALQNLTIFLETRIRNGNRGQKGFGVRMQRVVVQLGAARHFNDFPQIHHRYPVAHIFHHTQIVGDKQVGELKLILS